MNPVKVIVAACLLVPGIALLAFGPRPDDTLPKNCVIVDYWEKWTGNEESQMRVIVDQFNDTVGKDKGIYVRYVSTSSVNQKTLIATAAGVPPDIAGLWDSNLVQFAALDALEPLETIAREHGIDEHTYKPVYWNSCNYDGHLFGLVSTPMAVALHYNTRIFQENADALRAAGLDPDRAPRTIAELDAYSKVLTIVDSSGHLVRSGYLPSEPGWYLNCAPYWFGGSIWDEKTHRFTLTDPRVIDSFRWIQSYSKNLGKEATSEFRSGLGNFDSPQNPFLSGSVVMEQQGPWMANYINALKPSMSTLLYTREQEMKLPLAERRKNYEWAAAAFPSASPELTDVSYCGFDTFVIPRGAKHKADAFEFLAYVNRQDVMEKLCMMHCKNSPLEKVSDDFLNHHPNPYIDVFERLARSPNAHGLPQIPILPEAFDELTNVTQRVVLLDTTPEDALADAQQRLQEKYDDFMARQRARHSAAASAAANQ